MIQFKNIQIQENINLGALTTMKLGGQAKFFTTVKNVEEIQTALDFAREKNLPILVLGGGSNLIVRDKGFGGIVLQNKILGVEEIADTPEHKIFKVGAGEIWDDFCRFAVAEQGLSGCESMVMIPGSVGALAVQNVGAYGQETAAILDSLEAINLETGTLEVLTAAQCRLGYRTSIFREEAAGKYFITSVNLRLNKEFIRPSNFYISIEDYFFTIQIDRQNVTPEQIMRAVIEIRSAKLPDPADIPSAGSFFKNVEFSKNEIQDFRAKFPEAPVFEENGKFKVPTGWLIDAAGLRGQNFFGMRPHHTNALILTNLNAKNYADLAAARKKIVATVFEKFGIKIEQEPLEV